MQGTPWKFLGSKPVILIANCIFEKKYNVLTLKEKNLHLKKMMQ
jgi:hypothetical protein